MIIKTVICICSILLSVTGLAHAHPDSGFLPDAIAETEYRIVIELNTKDIETRNKLGIVLYRKARFKEALEQFKAVLRWDPDNFDAHDGTGLIMMKQKRYKGAVKWFKKAILINEADAMVHYHLGSAYRATGKTAKAIESYETSLSIKKNDAVSNELKLLRAKAR